MLLVKPRTRINVSTSWVLHFLAAPEAHQCLKQLPESVQKLFGTGRRSAPMAATGILLLDVDAFEPAVCKSG